MGYSTNFSGSLTISPALTEIQTKYIKQFNETRRMKRNASIAESFSDPTRIAVGLPIGVDGAYYVGSTENHGQNRDESILDFNEPPGMIERPAENDWNTWWTQRNEYIQSGKCQPGLWCGWTVTDDGTQLKWDGGEKFYEYVLWLHYLISHFFNVWGVKLNGEIFWEGEDSEDMGKIEVVNSVITVKNAKITYE